MCFSITNSSERDHQLGQLFDRTGRDTRFIQQSANSSVLNRITGQDPSRILGALQSNGPRVLTQSERHRLGREAPRSTSAPGRIQDPARVLAGNAVSTLLLALCWMKRVISPCPIEKLAQLMIAFDCW